MSELPPVVERFLRYVKIDTQSAEDSQTYPSTEKQKDLSRLLVGELQALGITDAAMNEHGYVIGTVPTNLSYEAPVIGLIAHVDTSPEVSGAGVNPQLHRDYDGGPIELGHGFTLTPGQSPDLLQNKGNTIITTDGSTLLGADNKAGVAEIITLVERLRADPAIPHGKLRLAFTCDEEVGNGTKHFDVEAFGADYAYTVDGEAPGEIENETFCADSATIKITGVNVHPGYAKDKLVNAVRAAAAIIDLLPKEMAPETTEGRQGYLHPVSVAGNVEEATIKLILRDFDEEPLRAQRDLLGGIIARAQAAFPRAGIEVSYAESYRNMRFVLDQHPRVVEHAMEAVRRAGLKARLNIIRGGTDGARLSFLGLPTPNIFTGGHLFHSRFEWVAVEGMQAAVETLVQLVQVWAEQRG